MCVLLSYFDCILQALTKVCFNLSGITAVLHVEHVGIFTAIACRGFKEGQSILLGII